jgi:hypothetical protein
MMKYSGSEGPNWNVVGPAIKNFLSKLDFHPPVTGAKPNTAVPLTEHFYSRTEELQTITDHLLHDHIIPFNIYRSTNVIVLSSQISRMGRTQLAAAFYSKAQKKFQSILWFNAKTNASSRKSCHENAGALRLVEDFADGADHQYEQACQKLRDYFHETKCESPYYSPYIGL